MRRLAAFIVATTLSFNTAFARGGMLDIYQGPATTVAASIITGTVPIANGGTNSTTALSGNTIMISNGSAVIQGAAGTSTTLLHGNASGSPTYSAVNLTAAADITGTLPAANGGTGVTSATGSGSVVLSNTPTFDGNTNTHEKSSAGGTVNDIISNTDNTSTSSDAVSQIKTGGASGGNPYTNYTVTGATNWSAGIDNTDSDTYSITEAASVVGVNKRFRMSSGGTLRLSAYGAGAATFDSSGNITSVSDERLKNIQGDFKRGLKEIMNVKPILYKWNKKSGMETENTYAGFSAQNVMETIPEAVMKNPQGYYAFQDRPVMGAMLNAIKELANRVEVLEKQIAVLQAK